MELAEQGVLAGREVQLELEGREAQPEPALPAVPLLLQSQQVLALVPVLQLRMIRRMLRVGRVPTRALPAVPPLLQVPVPVQQPKTTRNRKMEVAQRESISYHRLDRILFNMFLQLY